MRFPKRPFRLALLLAGLLLVVACGYDSYFLLQSTPDARPLWTGIPHNPGYTATPVPATDTPTWQATATAHPAGQAGEWFAFNLPWDDASLSWVDASDLTGGGSGLAGLVDRRGFVTMDDNGHFIFSNTGERARFWGVNLTYGAALPPCPDAPPGEGDFPDEHAGQKLARRLASLGFNAVRLHSLDEFPGPEGLWADWADTQQIDTQQMRRLDCLIYELKQNGIYVDLGLRVNRQFTRLDGVTGAVPFELTYKGATLFDPVIIALQRDYARQLLSHVNPYTGLSYAQDPVILATETNNEDSLFLSLALDELVYDPADPTTLSEFYSRELDGWTRLSRAGPQINRLENPGFEDGLAGWGQIVEGSARVDFEVDERAYEGEQALGVWVRRTGVDAWQSMIFQDGLALQTGRSYRLSFAVRGSQSTSLQVGLFRSQEPRQALGSDVEIPVTTEWVTHSVVFTPNETVLGGAAVGFAPGMAQGTVWLDSLSFQEMDAFPGWLGWLEKRYGSTEALAAAWANGGTVDGSELLNNGSFELGLKGWVTQTVEGAQAAWSLETANTLDGGTALRAQVSQVDGTDWHVQFWQTDLPIESGQKYLVSFDAKSEGNGLLWVDVIQDHEPWEGLGLWSSVSLGPDWKHYELVWEANASEPVARLDFVLGDREQTVWIDNVELQRFGLYGLRLDESLEANFVRRMKRSEFPLYTRQRVDDLLQFYAETQAQYFIGMRDYIQKELGSQSLNTGTNSYINSLPDIQAMANLDFVDNHLYWDHPYWVDALDWSDTGWLIKNQPWVNAPFEGLFDKAVTVVKGKPFTLTEFKEVFPNQYAVEGPLLIASFASLQDWDGVFIFDYAGYGSDYDAQQVVDFFGMAGNPLETGLMPLAARLFLEGQVASAAEEILQSYTQREVFDSVGYGWAGSGAAYLREAKGVDSGVAFTGRLRIDEFAAARPETRTPAGPQGPIYRSAGGQLAWDISEAERGLFTIDSPAAQGVVGFLEGRAVELSNLRLEFPADGTQFGAVLLQSRDGQPIDIAEEMTLGVFTRVENTGMVWNAEHTSLDDRWGEAPAILEPIQFTLTLSWPEAGQIEVWALDESGAPRDRLAPLSVTTGQAMYWIDTGVDQTVWYGLRYSR